MNRHSCANEGPGCLTNHSGCALITLSGVIMYPCMPLRASEVHCWVSECFLIPVRRQPAWQTVFTTAVEENGLITIRDIHKASRGGNEEVTEFRVTLRFPHMRASYRTKRQHRKQSSCSVSGRGCGSREQSGASVPIHPPSPDQIQRRATKDDVTIPQLS